MYHVDNMTERRRLLFHLTMSLLPHRFCSVTSRAIDQYPAAQHNRIRKLGALDLVKNGGGVDRPTTETLLVGGCTKTIDM